MDPDKIAFVYRSVEELLLQLFTPVSCAGEEYKASGVCIESVYWARDVGCVGLV